MEDIMVIKHMIGIKRQGMNAPGAERKPKRSSKRIEKSKEQPKVPNCSTGT